MRKNTQYIILSMLAVLLLVSVKVNAFTNSPNINLHIPQVGDSGTSWGQSVSNNFTLIDSFFCNRISFLTPDRLAIFNSGSCFEDGDLLNFVTGVDNRISIQTDGAGGIFVNTPQDIGTTSTPIFNSLNLSGLVANRVVETGVANILQSAETIKFPEIANSPSALTATGQLYVLLNSVLMYIESDGTSHEISGGVVHSHGTIYNDNNNITIGTSSGNFEILNGATAGVFDNTTLDAALGNITVCSDCSGHFQICGGVSFRSTTGVSRVLTVHAFQNGAIINSAGRRRTTTSTGWGAADIGCPQVEVNGNDYFELRLLDTSGTPADINVNEYNLTITRTGN
ncbi:MAG: hypothetical protein KAV87_17010 [Desulfobacteraceae bacterium]|nr:hypothetical protein [Desulfobacteraceae bacterium]